VSKKEGRKNMLGFEEVRRGVRVTKLGTESEVEGV
jgi:hypothetical protein